MKTRFLRSLFSLVLFGEPLVSQGQDKPSFQLVFDQYFNIANALTTGSSSEVSKGASAFTMTLQSIDVNLLSAKERSAFESLQTKLITASQELSKAKDLSRQRLVFQGLSADVIALRKQVKGGGLNYVAYCPMKKAYWLTREKEIKNPYYGTSMLNCGSINETIQ